MIYRFAVLILLMTAHIVLVAQEQRHHSEMDIVSVEVSESGKLLCLSSKGELYNFGKSSVLLFYSQILFFQ